MNGCTPPFGRHDRDDALQCLYPKSKVLQAIAAGAKIKKAKPLYQELRF